MRIVELQVSDYMGCEAVEIRPTDDVVTIGGRNGAGKTSVLNAIVSTLGGAKEIPGVPVRDGGEQAVTRLTLSRPEGDLHVIRAIKPDGKTTLTVKSADGAKYSKPQQLLDGLVGAIGFDPHAFTRLDQRKQAEQLRGLVGIDFSEIDSERQNLYSERTDINRDIKRLEGAVASMPKHDLKAEGVADSSSLFEELEVARETTRTAERSEQNMRSAKRALDQAGSELFELQKQLAEIQRAISEKEKEVENCGKNRTATLKEFEASQSSVIDESEIMERIRGAEAHNEKVAANNRRSTAESELAARKSDADKLTKEIAGLDEEKRMAMSAASWPVEGLGFDETGGVTFNGRPFAQASSAEQLRVSLAMGMALNPQLRVLIIRDGSLIDDDTMGVIRQAVTDNESQLWIERVSANGEGCTLVIEEGRVKGADAPQATRKRVAKASA